MAASGPLPSSEMEASRPSTASIKRKGFVSPTSSFVDFGTLETEYFSPEGNMIGKSYNPHRNRVIKKPTTNKETCIHLLKGSVGAGVLAMPKAFFHSGYAVGVFGSLALGILCIYAIDTLIRMQYIQCKRLQVPFLTLPRSMRIAFLNGPKYLKWCAPFAMLFVDFFLVTYQLGICSAYVVFMAESIKSVVDHHSNTDLNKRYYMLMLFIPTVLVNFIRNLKKLTPVSLAANILIICALSAVFFVIFFVGDWSPAVSYGGKVENWPLFLATVLFSLEAVGVIIALEHNMENPDSFLGKKGIFPWSLAFVITLYVTVGLVGYLKYGKDLGKTEVDTIISALPTDEGNVKWLPDVIRVIYIVCIFGTYPLQCYVSLEIIWGNYLVQHIPDQKKECIVEYALRVIVVVVTFIFALVVPHVDSVISLVGAFCLSFLGIIFPFVMELCTMWPDELGRYKHVLVKDVSFILLGFFILIVGTYTSIADLVHKLKEETNKAKG